MEFRIIESKNHPFKKGDFIKKIGPHTDELINFASEKAIFLRISMPEKKLVRGRVVVDWDLVDFWIPISQIKNVTSNKGKSELTDEIVTYHDIELSSWFLDHYSFLKD